LAPVAGEFARDGGLMHPDALGDLGSGKAGLHEGSDVVSLLLSELCVASHEYISICIRSCVILLRLAPFS